MRGQGIEPGTFEMFLHTISKNETRGRSLKQLHHKHSTKLLGVVGKWTVLPTCKEGTSFGCTNGEPAILSIIHPFTVNETREYDFRTTYDNFRDMFTMVFCLLVIPSQISINQLLAPGTVLSELLDDLEKHRKTAFPTCAQVRDARHCHGIRR